MQQGQQGSRTGRGLRLANGNGRVACLTELVGADQVRRAQRALYERHRHQLNDGVCQGAQRAALLGLVGVGGEIKAGVRVRVGLRVRLRIRVRVRVRVKVMVRVS